MDKVLNAIGATNANIGALKSENKIIYWVVGSAFAVITILLAVIALKK